MNKTFVVASIENSWHQSPQLAEQLILQIKMFGGSAVLLDLSHANVSREIFRHLKSYADQLNLAVVATCSSKEKFEWIQEEQIKIHLLSNDVIKKPVLCASMVQTGIPALVPFDGGKDFPLGDDFKNVKYLQNVGSTNELPSSFEGSLVGILDHSSNGEASTLAVKNGCKIIIKNYCLDKTNYNPGFIDCTDLLELRKKLNKVEMGLQ